MSILLDLAFEANSLVTQVRQEIPRGYPSTLAVYELDPARAATADITGLLCHCGTGSVGAWNL